MNAAARGSVWGMVLVVSLVTSARTQQPTPARQQPPRAEQPAGRQQPAPSDQQQQPSSRIELCPPLEKLGYQFKSIGQISVNVAMDDPNLPPDCATMLFHAAGGHPYHRDVDVEFQWAATDFHHQPLYFDDTPLERYGQSHAGPIQPWLSGARFFTAFPIIPYKMGVDRTHDRIYSLGYYRPGSPTPPLRQRIPLEADAALLESGAWVGLIFLLP